LKGHETSASGSLLHAKSSQGSFSKIRTTAMEDDTSIHTVSFSL
jgi:hypothetical protein